MDYTAYTADAYSVLSNFATPFSGMAVNMDTNQLNLHTTGYSSVAYNNLMEAIYYIPYYASLDSLTAEHMTNIKTEKPYVETSVAFATNSVSQISAAVSAVRASLVVGDLYKLKADEIAPIVAKINKALTPVQYANRELVRAYETIGANFSAQGEIDMAIAEAYVAQADAVAALEAAGKLARAANSDPTNKEKAAAAEQGIAQMKEVFATYTAKAEATEALFKAQAEAAKTAAQGYACKTLYEEIAQIYADNGITPTTDSSKWAAQKSILLHKAEEMLMQDMPVIPVIFTQNAVLSSELLTKINYRYTPYYTPYYFTKTSLKDYQDYMYYSELEKDNVSIFSEFPNIPWDKIGK